MFDNGRLKQATYDTSQGFGLRAVKDDAVGYAHSSDVSLPALIRAADAVHAVRGGYSGTFAAAPPHTNVRLYGDDNPLDAPGFESKVKLLAEIDAYVRDKRSAGAAGDGQPRRDLAGRGNPASRRRELSRHPPAGAGQCFGGRRPGRSPGKRQQGLWRPRRLCALHRDQGVARGRRRRDPRGAGQSGIGAGAGRRNGCRARRRLARRDAARGGRPRPRRRFQPQADLGLRRPDGPAGRGQGRHRGRRRHHCRRGAARCRSTTRARRPTAPC